jgi:gluconolactonase
MAGGITLLATRASAGPAVKFAPGIHRLSPALDRFFAVDTVPETVATGMRWAEGPVWLPAERALLFSDPPANIMRRWTRRDGVTVALSPSGAAGTDPKVVREPGSNGLALDRAGRLIAADSGNRALVRIALATGKRTILASRYAGKRFNSPNDLHIARSGAIYFTDPPYGLADGDRAAAKELPHNGVYRWTPGGRVDLLDATLTRPNGIALAPDERRLYVSVSDEAAPLILVYDLDSAGLPRSRRPLLDAGALTGPGLPDGMKVAPDGTIFCTGPGGLHVLSPEGERLGLIAVDGPIANCAFGESGGALFLTAGDRVLRVPLRPGAI